MHGDDALALDINMYCIVLIVVLPCILISSKLFVPTNALFIKT
jgi:hypothetical protein